jgi:hypothetical protein
MTPKPKPDPSPLSLSNSRLTPPTITAWDCFQARARLLPRAYYVAEAVHFNKQVMVTYYDQPIGNKLTSVSCLNTAV